jgi:hypothetical protein
MDGASPFQNLRDYWLLNAELPPVGVTSEDLDRFDARYLVRLPAEARQYFQTLNGTGPRLDAQFNRFLSLSAVQPLTEAFPQAGYGQGADSLFLFLDHSHGALYAAVRLSIQPLLANPVFRIEAHARHFDSTKVADSLGEFVARYLANPWFWL